MLGPGYRELGDLGGCSETAPPPGRTPPNAIKRERGRKGEVRLFRGDTQEISTEEVTLKLRS